MQDEIRDKSVALVIRTGKNGARLTEELLKWAIRQYQRQANEPQHGKQSVKSLVKQGAGVQNVEQHIMAKANIRLLLGSFHLSRHIIPGITLFPSHYSYELSVQLQTALSFQYKKGYASA